MLNLLRILLCGMGVFYVAVRFGRLLFSANRGYPLWPPADEPGEDRTQADATACFIQVDAHRQAPGGSGGDRDRAKHSRGPRLARPRP